jgi:phosphoglucomutase
MSNIDLVHAWFEDHQDMVVNWVFVCVHVLGLDSRYWANHKTTVNAVAGARRKQNKANATERDTNKWWSIGFATPYNKWTWRSTRTSERAWELPHLKSIIRGISKAYDEQVAYLERLREEVSPQQGLALDFMLATARAARERAATDEREYQVFMEAFKRAKEAEDAAQTQNDGPSTGWVVPLVRDDEEGGEGGVPIAV